MTEQGGHTVCPECGARLPGGVAQCDLCGYADRSGASGEEQRPHVAVEHTPSEAEPPSAAEGKEAHGPFCNQCGWQNPPGARFCSYCGAALQEISPKRAAKERLQAAASPVPLVREAAGASTQAERDPEVGRQVGIIVGAGVLLVVALYLVTVFSRDFQIQSARQTAPVQTEPSRAQSLDEMHNALALPPQVAERVEALEAEIESLEGPARVERQRELVNLFIGVGRIDRAAIAQGELAETADSPEEWKRAGNLYYDWMESIQGDHKPEVARLAVEAYQRVLEVNPEDANVRTDMAWAYQYVPGSAMEAIQQTNLVLEQNPEHIQANFNKGLFLMRVNRLDQALAQFEKVQAIVGDSTAVYRQAEAAIRAVRQMQAGGA